MEFKSECFSLSSDSYQKLGNGMVEASILSRLITNRNPNINDLPDTPHFLEAEVRREQRSPDPKAMLLA